MQSPRIIALVVLGVASAMLSGSRNAAVQILAAADSVQRPEVVDSVSPPDSVLLTYIRSLRFHRDHVLSDEQPLDWRRPSRQAARIEPVASSRPGGIVARMVNLGDSVPRFALATRGTTYIWVQGDPELKYAMLITMDAGGRLVGRTKVGAFKYIDPVDTAETYLHPQLNQSISRWLFDPRAKTSRSLVRTFAVGTCHNNCSPTGWCKSDTVGGSLVGTVNRYNNP